MRHKKHNLIIYCIGIAILMLLLSVNANALNVANTAENVAPAASNKDAKLPTLIIPNTPTSRVMDLASLLTKDEQKVLNSKLRNIYNNTNGVEIQILTIPHLNGEVIEDLTRNIGRKWKLGQSGINNGMLIVIAAAEHKYRLEVGYGLEGTLPDGYVGRIGRQFLVPNFKNGTYFQGLNLLIDNLTQTINKSNAYTKPKAINKVKNDNLDLILAVGSGVGFILICFIIMYLRNNTSNNADNSAQNNIYNPNFHPAKRRRNTLLRILGGVIAGIILSKLFNSKNNSGGSDNSSGNDSDDIGGGGDFGGGGSSGNY